MHRKADIVDLRFGLYGTQPQYITIGGQQSLWVTCGANTEIAGLMPDGSIEHYPVDAPPSQIALGGENIWFTMPIIDTLGRIDHSGTIQNYKLPQGSQPRGIATTENTAWVTLSGTGDLAKVSTDGTIQVVHPIVTGDDALDHPAPADSRFIAVDDQGSLWFTQSGRGDVVRLDADGTTESWTSPDWATPAGVAVDRDAVWIADRDGDSIWRIGRSEKLLQRVEPWPTNSAIDIASDAQGGCWFTEPDEDLVGHIDADAKLTEYDISDYGTKPRGLAVDRDGVAWIALWSGGIIGIAPDLPQPVVL